MTAHRRIGATAIAGLLLAALPLTSANADGAAKRLEQSTDIYCQTVSDGLTIEAGVNRNVSSEGVETYAFAAVYDEQGSDAYGETTGVVFEDGRIDATVSLVDHDDVPFGEAHLVGSYAVGESETWRGRPLKMIGNQYMVQSTTVAMVSVNWESLDVAGVELVTDGTTVVDPGCDGYDMVRDDILTDPHRLSFPVEEYVMAGECSTDRLSQVIIVPSEGGLNLVLFGEDGLLGETNLNVTETGPQPLQWWLPDAEEPVAADITVDFQTSGHASTQVTTEQGQTLRTTTRSMTMSFTAGLPDGTVTGGTCAVDHTTSRVVVEPMDGVRAA